MNNILLQNALKTISELTQEQLVKSMQEYGIKFKEVTDGIYEEPINQSPLSPELMQRLKILSQEQSLFDRTNDDGDPISPDDMDLNADDIFSVGYDSGQIDLAREILIQLMGKE
jgi:hypothetical protein